MKTIRTIPTLFGLTLVIALVALAGYVFDRVFRFETRASGSTTPEQVTFTNISDTSIAVSWTTASSATGAVLVEGPGQKRQTIFDERDTESPKSKKDLTAYTTHSVTVRNLKPTSLFSLKIVSNGKTYLNRGKPYSIQTGPTLTSVSNGLDPAYGTILDTTGQPIAGAIVYLRLDGGQELSALTKPNGTWLIPLNLSRTSDLLSSLTADGDRLEETIHVRTRGEQAQAITDTLNDSPVPAITLGRTYDFRGQQAQKQTQSNLASSQPSVLGTQTTTAAGSFRIAITKPANGEALTTNLPLIQGTGFPGKTVSVVVGITQPVSGTTAVGGDGIWRYTPTRFLAPGKQSVTMTTVDAKAKPVAITHTFEVLKSGTQVLGEATPSATFTPTPTPTDLVGQPVPTSGHELPAILLLLLGGGIFMSGIFFFAL